MTKIADMKLAALGAAVLVVTLAACGPGGSSSSTASSAAATATSPDAASLALGGKLTDLQAGATVEQQQSVSGVVTGLPAGDKAWLVVYPEQAKAYWPQKGPLQVDTAGAFKATAVFGSTAAGNAGQGFIVRLVITSASATRKFKAFLTDTSKGLPKLPGGVRTLTRVTVKRS